MGHRAAIYARVSTLGQNTDRQVADLQRLARHRGLKVVHIAQEKMSGKRTDRPARQWLLEMAQGGKIDAILITELSRWGRSTADVLKTLDQLASWNVSLIAESGIDLDLRSAGGKMMVTLLAGFAEFERDLTSERIRSGLARAKNSGKTLGRPRGINPSDKYANDVLAAVAAGKSYRWIARDLQISKNTVMAIVKRSRAEKA
ncbi:recombinase family protein [Palleronia sp.]|uniref:recombinase family protein n=1 Tax=Palleronia sp. TaxID=1940284 RepID=UPI0035C814E8